jgi:hypothetical protein
MYLPSRIPIRAALAFVFVLLAGFEHSAPAQAPPQLLFGVTPSNRLIVFFANNPSQVLHSVQIASLAAGEQIVGIDFRPLNRLLYGVSSASRLYMINYFDGSTIPIGGPIEPAFTGTRFGVDVNPSADSLRVVSDSGMNIRVNLDTGSDIIDTALAYGPADPNAGQTPGAVAATYANPDTLTNTGTTLFNVDATLDVATIQMPANDGQLNTIGSIGTDIVDAGLDMIGQTDFYASLQLAGTTQSIVIHAGAGGLTNYGPIAGGEVVPSLAIYLGPPISPPAERAFAVNTANELISFASNQPGTILSRAALDNLRIDDRIVGLDFRPANNLLYGLGASGQLYLINPSTARAGRIGASPSVPYAGTEFGFDFNPVVDRIRVVSDAGINLRLHPDTGALVATDTNLAYAPGDPNVGATPNVVGAAYLNPDRNPRTPTTLLVIDSVLDVGAVQEPANAGILSTLVRLGGDAPSMISFDVSTQQLLIVVSAGVGSPSALFGIGPGGPRFLGLVGNAETIVGLAISLGG